MVELELIFEVEALDAACEEHLVNTFDAFIGGHGTVRLLTITWEGATAVVAAETAVSALRKHGVSVLRMVEDLVTRKTIAVRSGKTTQAVGLWARGERQSQDPFPKPYILAGGGMWLWGEVNKWLARQGYDHDDVVFPSREDYARVNGWIQTERDGERKRSELGHVTVSVNEGSWRGSRTPIGGFTSVGSAQGEFALIS